MIEINNLIKEYNTSKKVVHASNDITYQFKSNGLHFILGKSGCGKTTLLNILSGLDSYDSGSVIVNGYNISKLTEKELDNYRNIHIGIIFQNFNLLQDINVYDNLKIVLKLQGSKCDEKNKLEQEDIKIEQILKEVGLEGYEKRKVSELSGGEKQRIAIARCLLKKTDIIFADEPTGNLDKKTGEAILDLLKQISKNRLVIVVSHDREAAYKYGDKIIHMSDGILHSLGVTMNDCIQIFALEFLIMFICSVVIVVPIIIRIISMVNNMYMDSLEGINYCIIDKSYIIFAIMFLVEITVNVLSIYIPIKAIRKKKPIEIINDR